MFTMFVMPIRVAVQFGAHPKYNVIRIDFGLRLMVSLLTPGKKQIHIANKTQSNSTNIIKLYDYYSIYFALAYIVLLYSVMIVYCRRCTGFKSTTICTAAFGANIFWRRPK